jgi:hypothetical protein
MARLDEPFGTEHTHDRIERLDGTHGVAVPVHKAPRSGLVVLGDVPGSGPAPIVDVLDVADALQGHVQPPH